jgi:hypothetical protein
MELLNRSFLEMVITDGRLASGEQSALELTTEKTAH